MYKDAVYDRIIRQEINYISRRNMDYGYYLKDYLPDGDKLEKYGFAKEGETWSYESKLDDSLILMLTLTDTDFTAKVWDKDFEDEYLPFNFEDSQNPVKARAEEIIADIVKECFVCLDIRENTVKALENRYGTLHEAPWEDDPYSITFKTEVAKKWYAIMMRITADRLGLKGRNLIDVVNIKLMPQEIDSLIDGVHFFRAYHMNKTHWMSVKLDKDLDMQKFLALTDESYALAENKKAAHKTKK